jgi:hypothetical protein
MSDRNISSWKERTKPRECQPKVKVKSSSLTAPLNLLLNVFDASQNVVENARLGAHEIYMLRFWLPTANSRAVPAALTYTGTFVIQNKISGPDHLSFLKVSPTLWTPSTIYCRRLFAFLFDRRWIVARSTGTISLLA